MPVARGKDICSCYIDLGWVSMANPGTQLYQPESIAGLEAFFASASLRESLHLLLIDFDLSGFLHLRPQIGEE